MGHIIERIALERGNTITCRIDRDNPGDFDSEAFLSSDVAIEFSTPGTAPDNLLRCFRRGIPVVCGTTGWTARLDEFRQLCDDGKGTLLWASNFSVGVNLFRAISRSLARMMDAFPQYRPRMEEVHHVHKLDHPSGTAVTLAEDIVAACRPGPNRKRGVSFLKIYSGWTISVAERCPEYTRFSGSRPSTKSP